MTGVPLQNVNEFTAYAGLNGLIDSAKVLTACLFSSGRDDLSPYRVDYKASLEINRYSILHSAGHRHSCHRAKDKGFLGHHSIQLPVTSSLEINCFQRLTPATIITSASLRIYL